MGHTGGTEEQRLTGPSSKEWAPVDPGGPALITSLLFMIISGMLLFILKRPNALLLEMYGFVVLMAGSVGLLGYAFNIPVFYFAVEGYIRGMAFLTALMFSLLGVGLFLLGQHSHSGR